MVEVRFHSGLGNRLFQYCFGRILAERLGYRLQANPFPNFPGTASGVDGLAYEQPVWFCPEAADPDEICQDQTPRRIVVNCYMQQYRPLHPHRERIRQWLHLGRPKVITPHVDGLVVHIRLGDYFQHGWVLSPEYYHEIIARERFSRLYIVTDEPDSPYLRTFRGYRPTWVLTTPVESLRFMGAAHRIVLSQSTYGWWGAFFSQAERIYFPLPRQSLWTPGQTHVDLRVDDPRYIYVPDVATLPIAEPISPTVA